MDYLKQTYKVLHDWWRYLVGVIVIFVAWQIVGMIPLLVFLGIEMVNGAALTTDISAMA